MSFDPNEVDALLQRARQHADEAVSRDDPTLYREAFQAMSQAVALLARGNNDWREQVLRATEEFTRTEGI